MWGIWIDRDGRGEWASRDDGAEFGWFGRLWLFHTQADAERQAAAWRAVSVGRTRVTFHAKPFF